MEPQPTIEPKNPSRLPVIILKIIIVLSLGLSAFLYYQNTKLQKQINTLTQTPTVFPTPEEEGPPLEDPTAAWQTYSNTLYGFSTRYDPQSPPEEIPGNNQVGQFTYIVQIKFGTNSLKYPHGYTLEINQQKTKENYREELIGHITDTVDSEKNTLIKGIEWTELNYQLFEATINIPVTLAFTSNGKYGYAITAPTNVIHPILSTFKFTN